MITLCGSSSRLYRFAKFKKDGFRWAGYHDFLNEIYLTMSFVISINTSSISFTGGSAIIVNSCFAIVMALVCVFTPIYLAVRSHLDWKRATITGETTVTTVKDFKEGGEKEEGKPSKSNR